MISYIIIQHCSKCNLWRIRYIFFFLHDDIFLGLKCRTHLVAFPEVLKNKNTSNIYYNVDTCYQCHFHSWDICTSPRQKADTDLFNMWPLDRCTALTCLNESLNDQYTLKSLLKLENSGKIKQELQKTSTKDLLLQTNTFQPTCEEESLPTRDLKNIADPSTISQKHLIRERKRVKPH